MKIVDFIAALQELPQDAFLFVEGYEGGLDDAGTLTFVKVERNRSDEVWYYGAHKSSSTGTCLGYVISKEDS